MGYHFFHASVVMTWRITDNSVSLRGEICLYGGRICSSAYCFNIIIYDCMAPRCAMMFLEVL
jgi:hypothetical protein